jgi:hypothetical protein
MFRLPKLGVVLTFIAMLIFAAPALATDYQYSSTDEHVDAASGDTTGTETGDLSLGTYTGNASATIDPVTGAITDGTQTITFDADGSTLSISFSGQIFADGSVVGTFSWTGGTGALDGASGSGTFVGTTDGVGFDVDVEGTLTLP